MTAQPPTAKTRTTDLDLLQPIAARPLLSATLFLLIGILLTGVLSWQILDSLRARTATETARAYAASMTLVRSYYTQEIVPRARKAGTEIRHDYASTDDAIPMPATLSIELGNRMEAEGSPARMRFYSAWPYPYRANGGARDAFEQRAIDSFDSAGSMPIIEVNAGLGSGILRYAEPVIMGAGCVACHNADPQSPRRDWVVGEVGGAQAVVINLPALLPGLGDNAIRVDDATVVIMIGLVAALLFVTTLMFMLLRRLNQSLQIAARQNLKLHIAREAAEVANASKTRMMAHVSHDLRTPLNAIIGFSDLISREALGKVGVAKYLTYANDIHSSGQRLLSIIENMFSYADIGTGEVSLHASEIALGQELQRLKLMMTPLTSEYPRPISLVVPPDIPNVHMDRRALRSILGNLLGNAIQYAGPGAEIWLIAGHAADGVTIEVRDNGAGISAEALKRIMLPFERVSNPYLANDEGIGLGLSIAHELAALQGTTLTITSELKKGTVATLHVPANRTIASGTHVEEVPMARTMTG